MRKKLSILKDIIFDIAESIKEYLKPDIIYRPYEPKVLGNKFKGDRR